MHDRFMQAGRSGQDLRPVYEAALRQPQAGGVALAQQIEGFCYLVAARAQQQAPGGTLQVRADDAAGAAFHRTLEKGRFACASIQPGEIDPANTHRRLSAAGHATGDPLLAAHVELLKRPQGPARAAVVQRLLAVGAPANLWVLKTHFMLLPPGESSLYFDGRYWPLTSPDGQERLAGRADQLVAALALARCELGEPCGPDSLNAQQHCLQQPIDCAEADYPAMVRAALRRGGYVDVEPALAGFESVRDRLVQAIRQRHVNAFVPGR